MDLSLSIRPEFSTRYFAGELCVRVFLALVFLKTELTEPFARQIQPEEVWLYRYPMTDSYVPSSALWFMVFAVPVVALGAWFLRTYDWIDLRESGLAFSMALLLNGIVTNSLKLVSGRPRPDFMERCYPGQANPRPDRPCTGDPHTVAEGRKSFPSGHSSFFTCLAVFVFLYWSGKLGTFTERGRRQSYSLLVMFPLLLAALVAVSRTCDYHHHWQDVMIGCAIGALIAHLVYRHFYPSIFSANSDRPYCVAGMDLLPLHATNGADGKPIPGEEVKWI